METFFTELGRGVLARWQARNFALPAFPDIAREALEKRPPAEHVDLGTLTREFLLNDDQPFQTHSGFGQPELVVFDDPRVYIQILFWMEGTTDIHQHEFSGAFHVVAGSSIHSEFTFEKPQSISAHMRLGHLRMKHTELLETGRTVPIVSGPAHIHSLFHLDSPSATVVVRTQNDPGTGPQFTYLPPHVAVDPVHDDALTMRRKQLLDVLEKSEPSAFVECTMEMLTGLDFERGFYILQNVMSGLRELGEWEAAMRVFRTKHGKLAAGIGPTLDEIVRRDGIASLRATITDVEHRFFLALLLNVPERSDILAMIRQRFRGNPLNHILRWAGELMEISDEGTWLLDAEFPQELGVAIDDQPELFLSALRYFVSAAGSVQGSKSMLQSMRRVLDRSSWRALIVSRS